MIKLRLDADGSDLDDALRHRIDERIGSLDEYLPALAGGHVTVSADDRREKTEVRTLVWGGKNRFEASSTETVGQRGRRPRAARARDADWEGALRGNQPPRP